MSVEMVLATSKGGRGFLGSEHAVWKLLMPYRGEYVPRVGEHVKLFHELELELEVTDVTWHSQGAEGFQPSVYLQDLILSPTEGGEADLEIAARQRRQSGNPRPLPATWPEEDDEKGQVFELLSEYGWRFGEVSPPPPPEPRRGLRVYFMGDPPPDAGWTQH